MVGLNLRLLAAAISALAVVAAVYSIYRHGRQTMADEIELQSTKDKVAQQAKKLEEKQGEIAQLQEQAATLQRLSAERQKADAATASRLVAMVDSLRNRIDRPAPGASHPPAAGQGATGAELYRPDAMFLAGEAARADRLRSALRQCYAYVDQLPQECLKVSQPPEVEGPSESASSPARP